ncbi:hypothetical protein UFOVP1290_619 [uncultured Caudovirales phage]|uniref:Uncharacterized protein n=1 Tax=uncultured Caudovirales phage TaxID=2100421 RepID=A0A6J5RJA0_9CAUD|nr:hypothetical protein UFOVP1290_619 [uncultured Caudovirales phage]
MINGNNIIKKSYSTQMSYDISDSEKESAENALLCFTHALKKLSSASEHLNIIKTPFKDNPEVDPKALFKARVKIRKFRDKSLENFTIFKKYAFKCVNSMQSFASDTQTVKLMKSFINSVNDLENSVNDFVLLFNDLESKDFTKDIVTHIEKIQEQCDEIEKIIDDRIKNHIQSNILATSWVDSVSNELQMKIEEKTPLIIDLFNERQDKLNHVIKERKS